MVRLKDLEAGEQACILFTTSVPGQVLDRLMVYGIIPGNYVRLHQKKPAYIIQVDETFLALESNLCEGIFVKKQPNVND